MTTFPDPVFTIPNAKVAEETLQAEYTIITGKDLLPAQPETLLANWAAYLKTVTDTNIQFTGEQCLVNFADNQNLDQLGTFWDAPRLSPEPAITTLQFNLDAVAEVNVFIPQGTRVRTTNREIIFTTDDIFFIPKGQLSGSIGATANTTGTSGNGYAVGTITELIDPINLVTSVSNTTISNSGRDSETDEEYRSRLREAPNKITVAGSLGQYKFITKTIDGDIVDVAIQSPTGPERGQDLITRGLELSQLILDDLEARGVDILDITAEEIQPLTAEFIQIPRYTVDIYLLTASGQPTTDLINKVQAFYDSPETRPLTDVVRVFAPIPIELQINVRVIIFTSADGTTIQSRLEDALQAYVDDITAVMGIDVVPSQIIDRLSIETETYEIEVLQPADLVEIRFNEYPVITSQTVQIVGDTEG